MIIRILPAGQWTLIELLNAVPVAIVVRVVDHDALVIELLAEGLDGLTVDASATYVLKAGAAIRKRLLVILAEIIFRNVGLLKLGLLVTRAVILKVAVEDLDVLVAVGALMLMLHAFGESVSYHRQSGYSKR